MPASSAWLWNWPERLRFDGEQIIRSRLRRRDQVLAVRDVSRVEGGYTFHVGPRVYVMGGDPWQAIKLVPGPEDHQLMLRRSCLTDQ